MGIGTFVDRHCNPDFAKRDFNSSPLYRRQVWSMSLLQSDIMHLHLVILVLSTLTFHLGVCVVLARHLLISSLQGLHTKLSDVTCHVAARVRAGSLLHWLGVEIWLLGVEQREHNLGLVSSAKDNRWLPLEDFLVDIVRFAVVPVF